MNIRIASVVAIVVSGSAFAGNAPPVIVQATGSTVVPVTASHDAAPAADATASAVRNAGEAGIKGDCLFVDGEVISCFGVAGEMARINREAKIKAAADPSPTPCLAYVRYVRELAPQYDVYSVTSNMGGWENHASALVVAKGREFLLDNGALREAGVWGREGSTRYDWAEVTGIDRSGWHVDKVASR